MEGCVLLLPYTGAPVTYQKCPESDGQAVRDQLLVPSEIILLHPASRADVRQTHECAEAHPRHVHGAHQCMQVRLLPSLTSGMTCT